MKMKERLQIAARMAVRKVLKVFLLFPADPHRILFESYDGTAYSCSPKYLSEYLETERAGEYDIVWSFREPQEFTDLLKKHRIRMVKKRSLRWFFEYMTAGTLVTNVAAAEVFFPKRRDQLVINTWHAGGAYKRTGVISEHVQANTEFQKWRRREQAGRFDVFLSSSPVFTRTNVREAYGFEGPVVKSGLPRNDLFFDEERVQRASKKVRKKFGLTGYVVLYAPTYRGNINRTEALPPLPAEVIAKGIKERYGCEATILVRAHYADRANILGNPAFPRMIDVTDYPDMQELLAASELLITDYSSSIWDFSLFGRPCLLYVPDLASYMEHDRGFYTPISEWPGIVCEDEEQLLEALVNLSEEEAKEKAAAHLGRFGSYENGKACEVTEKVIRHFALTGELR